MFSGSDGEFFLVVNYILPCKVYYLPYLQWRVYGIKLILASLLYERMILLLKKRYVDGTIEIVSPYHRSDRWDCCRETMSLPNLGTDDVGGREIKFLSISTGMLNVGYARQLEFKQHATISRCYGTSIAI
jgi:hypothetical protein